MAVRLAELRGKLELELVAQSACDPLHSSRLCRECGVTADLFAYEDLRLIWLAIDLTGERGLEKTAKVARLALRYHGYWDQTDTRSFTRGSLWSDYSLAGLFTSRFYAPSMIRLYASRLCDVDRRERIATTCEQRATAAIEGGIHAIETLFLGAAGDKTSSTLGFPEVSSLSLTREGGNHE